MPAVLSLFLFLLSLCVPALAQPPPPKDKVIHLVTFEAPPFMSEKMPEQGAAVYALRQLLKKNGYDLKISFAPFLRAKKQVLQKNEISGFFPVTEVNVTADFRMSNVMYVTPWVFAERKDHPIVWQEAKDLTAYKIGNVMGYDLAKMVAPLQKKKKLHIENASSDELNLLKLARKRVDLAFIDATMFEYLTRTSPRLRPFQNQLQINAKIIHMDEYAVAFKKTPRSLRHLEIFNKSITKESFTHYVELYFKNNLSPTDKASTTKSKECPENLGEDGCPPRDIPKPESSL